MGRLLDTYAAAEEQTTFLEKTGEFVHYGLAGSVVSAGTSLVNTGIALGNAFGLDGEYIENEDVLTDYLGAEYGEYYNKNSAVVDGVGLAIGSLAPGLAAVKAARLLAQGTLATRTTRMATGIREALFSETRLAAHKAAIVNSKVNDITKAGLRKLAAQNLGQQFTEAAVYEAATLLTLNQSPTLNSEEVGYFSAIANNLDTAAFGAALGGGLGGGLGYFVEAGSLKRFVSDAQRLGLDGTGKNSLNNAATFFSGGNNAIVGDRVQLQMLDVVQKQARIKQINNMDNVAKAAAAPELDKLNNAVLTAENTIIAELNDVAGGTEFGTVLVESLRKHNVDGEAQLNTLAGLVKLRPLKESDSVSGVRAAVIPDSDAAAPSLFTKQYPELVIDEIPQVARIEDKLLDPNITSAEAADLFLEAAGLVEVQTIRSIWNSPTVYVARRGVDRKVQRYTKAEAKARKKKPGAAIRDPLHIQNTLHDFNTQFDSRYAADFENLARLTDEVNLVGPSQNLNLIEQYGEAIDAAMLQGSPDRMFSTAYRILNTSEVDEAVLKSIAGDKSEFSALAQWMRNNKVLSERYGTKTVYMSPVNGKIVNEGRSVHVADLGNVAVRKNSVITGGGDFQLAPLNPEKQTTAAASANYAWAASKSGAGVGLVTPKGLLQKAHRQIPANDLPRLQALAEFYDFQHGAVNLVDAVDDAGVPKLIKLESAGQLREHIFNEKEKLIKAFSAEGKLNGRYLSEVAAYADVSEDYVMTVAAGVDPKVALPEADAFFTSQVLKRSDDSFQPNTLALEYDASVYSNDGIRLDSKLEITRRNQVVFETDQRYAATILGEETDLFPQSSIQPDGAINLAHDVSSVQDTTTLLKSANADYLSGASYLQDIGQATARTKVKRTDRINNRLRADATAAIGDKSALQELSVLEQSILRSDQYKFLPRMTDSFTDDTLSIYRAVGIDVEHVLESQVLRSAGITDATQVIIQKELFDEVDNLLRTVDIGPQDSQDMLQAIRQAAVDGTAQDVIAQMRQALAEPLDTMILQLKDKLADVTPGVSQYKKIHNIQNKTAANFLRTRQEVNHDFVIKGKKALDEASSTPNNIDPDVLYPGPMDTEKFKHVAFVSLKSGATDPYATKSQGMLFGHSADELEAKVNHLKSKDLYEDIRILTKEQSDDWLEARGLRNSELAMTDNRVDASLRNDGKLWSAAPEFDPKVVEGMINSLVRQSNNVVTQTVKLKYASEYTTLRQLHKAFKPYGPIKKADAKLSTYQKQINLMLDATDKESYQWWFTTQELADEAVSRGKNAITGAFQQARTSGDWKAMDDVLTNYGFPKIYEGPEDWILSRATAGEHGELRKLISKANSLFSTTMLRLDSAQGVVNSMSTPIMGVSEMQGLLHKFGKLTDPELKQLGLSTTVPYNQLLERAPSNMKIIQQAAKNYATDRPRLEEYVRHGTVSNAVIDLRNAQELAGYVPDTKAWKDNLEKAVNLIATPVDKSEEFVKFMASDVARQTLDLMKVPKDHPLYWSTIKTFVSRTHGNYTASQRPALFQGWAGQAIGLFQTYQFNMIQQFMKHIEDGNGAAKYLAGLQTATFGTQSLPGFQLVNDHIGQQALGERDIYSTVTETFDNPVAEFLLYGGGSSLTRPLLDGKGIAFYTRGDLTPRTPILVPTSFDEVPAISFVSSLMTSLKNTMDGISQGGDGGTVFLNALASNGVNRPLAGGAQLLQGYKTSGQGNLLFSYNEVGYALGIAKAMGAKTMDEAIASQAYYRSQKYKAHQSDNLSKLAKVTKARMSKVDGLQSDEVQDVMRRYVEIGGNIDTFSRWMKNNYASAHDSNVNKMRENLNNAQGRYMQSLLGANVDELDSMQFE